MDFRTAYENLEGRMKAMAESEGAVYLPNIAPSGPVDLVFICMEPSLGGWARSRAEAQEKVEAGFRNFLSSFEDFLLHFAIREFLCTSGERYHLTDISKGAMLVKSAQRERGRRYDRWLSLLCDELSLVAKPGAHVFAVGGAVYRYLVNRDFPWDLTRIMHYSGMAGAARKAAVIG